MKSIQKSIIRLSALLVFIPGCASHNTSHLKESYLLETSRPGSPEAVSPIFAGVLKIRHCRAVQPFDSRQFLYKDAVDQYEQDFYREFLTPPNEQITELLRAYLEGSGLFANVIPASSAIEAEYMLEPQLLAIYTDFADPVNPKTIIKMHLVLIRMDKVRQSSSIILEKTYLRSETFQEKSGKSIINGYNTGLQAIFAQLAEDLRDKGK